MSEIEEIKELYESWSRNDAVMAHLPRVMGIKTARKAVGAVGILLSALDEKNKIIKEAYCQEDIDALQFIINMANGKIGELEEALNERDKEIRSFVMGMAGQNAVIEESAKLLARRDDRIKELEAYWKEGQ